MFQLHFFLHIRYPKLEQNLTDSAFFLLRPLLNTQHQPYSHKATGPSHHRPPNEFPQWLPVWSSCFSSLFSHSHGGAKVYFSRYVLFSAEITLETLHLPQSDNQSPYKYLKYFGIWYFFAILSSSFKLFPTIPSLRPQCLSSYSQTCHSFFPQEICLFVPYILDSLL